jgi:hypothetical protein
MSANAPEKDEKLVVAVDLDETIGGFLPALLNFHNFTFGTNFTVDQFLTYNFADTWLCSEEESTSKVHQFFASPYFEAIAPLAGARAVLEAHAPTCRFFSASPHLFCGKAATFGFCGGGFLPFRVPVPYHHHPLPHQPPT